MAEEIEVKAKTLNDWNFVQLKKLPVRDRTLGSSYNSVMVRSSSTEHESKFSGMLIIGCRYSKETKLLEPVEIIANGEIDDIEWIIPASRNLTDSILEQNLVGDLRTECLLKSGAINFWGNFIHFVISSVDASSLTIHVKKNDQTF